MKTKKQLQFVSVDSQVKQLRKTEPNKHNKQTKQSPHSKHTYTHTDRQRRNSPERKDKVKRRIEFQNYNN